MPSTSFANRPETAESQGPHYEQPIMTKCQVCKCLIKNCKCSGTEHLCKTCRERETLGEHKACTCCPSCGGSKIDNSCNCCRTCSKPDCGVCCTRCLQRKTSCDCCQKCQAIKADCDCPPKVQVPAKTSQPPTSSTMSSIEPPDMSILKDRSQLEFYTSALERWATIAKASGVAETLLQAGTRVA